MGASPLSRHCTLRSRHLDEVRSRVADAFCPHTLTLDGGERALDARFHSVQLGSVGFHYLEYGAAVHIAPRELEHFFLVQIPLRGSAQVRSGGRVVNSDVSLASVPDPEESLDMRWGRDNAQLIVWLDRPALEGTLTQMLGHGSSSPLRLDLEMDLRDSGVRSWLEIVRFLVDDLNGPALTSSNPVAQRHMEGLVMSQLLLTHRHSHRGELGLPETPAAPKAVRRAAEVIDAHADEPLTVQDVAEAVGVSIRCLQEGFRRYLDTTPTRYLRDARLARAHVLLESAPPGSVSVAEVASSCGFAHLGRFATDYRGRYGASPSATLRG